MPSPHDKTSSPHYRARHRVSRPIPRPISHPLPPELRPLNTAYHLLTLTNTLRRRLKLPSLRLSRTLCLVAREHSHYQASISQMTHRGRGGSHHADRMRQMGYYRAYSGENVAEGQRSVEEVFAGWLKSKSHRRNLLGRFREMGAWVVVGRHRRRWLYWTQVFGRRE